MKKLQLAKDLTLPVDVVTQTIAILAKRRAGKSYTMRRLAEQLFKADQQIVIVDPKGDQWGIRSAADGKSPGLPVIILGGERGDVPLEVQGGELVAKLVVEERVSVVLDLSSFRKREVAVFMAEFLENVYRMKAREVYRTPMMLVVDEADAIAPQKPQPGEERMLGAIEDIVRRGGQRGIGCTLVTQRSAVLNKNVLTQAQILVALRTIAPQDLKAMKEWIDVHGEESEREVLMASLPSLPIGDAWFWSPGWPSAAGIFERVHILPIETFDSGATPEPGKRRVEPKHAADVDIESLKRQMADVVERKKADDPQELRRQLAAAKAELATKEKLLTKVDVRTKRIEEKLTKVETSKSGEARANKIRELQQQLAQHRRALEGAMKILVKVKAIDFEVDTDEGRKALEQALAAAVKQVTTPIEKRVTALAEKVEGFRLAAKRAEEEISALLAEKVDLAVQVQKAEPFTVARPTPPARPVRQIAPQNADRSPRGDNGLGAGELKILTAIAQHEDGVTREQLTVLTGYKRSSRDTYLQRLSQRGLISVGADIRATDAGVQALGPGFEPLPKGLDLQAYWLDRLPSGERAILEPLIEAYPGAVDREQLSTLTGYKRSSRDTYLQRLSSRQLISVQRDGVKASDVLFD